MSNNNKKLPEQHCQDAIDTVGAWIETSHTPELNELCTLANTLDQTQKGIRVLKLTNGSFAAKLDLKDKEIVGLQQELTEVKEEVELLHTENLEMKGRIEDLEKFCEPIEAMSIVKAAERRFLQKLLENESEFNKLRYLSVNAIIDDAEDQVLPPSIEKKWSKHNRLWPVKPMRRVFRILSQNRGAVCHRDEREPEIYASMTVDSVESQMRIAGLNENEIALIVQLHNFEIEGA